MRAKLTKEEMLERVKFYEENGEAAFLTKYKRYRDVIYVYRKKLGLRESHKTNRTNKLPAIYSKSFLVNFTKEDKIKFIEYYKTHTCRDTGKRYGISTSYVVHAARGFSLELYGKPFNKDKYERGKLTKEEMMERIKFYEKNGETALKNKYKVGKSSINRYQCILNGTNRTNAHRSVDGKKKMIEYYKTHTAKETAIKYGFCLSSVSSVINHIADEIGYPKPLKYHTKKRIIDKEEMLERIKFYEENGIDKYVDKYGYCNKNTAQGSIVKYCKQLKNM